MPRQPQSLMNRRSAMALLTSALITVPHGPATAAAWPSKTLRIIVPFAPGGGADVSARVLAELLAPQLGQAVIVENKPGAGSAIGINAAAQSKDGHTMLMGSNNPNPLATLGTGLMAGMNAAGDTEDR